MTPAIERRHLEAGAQPGDRPLGTLIELNAMEVLSKAREVLRAVVMNNDPWPADDQWRQLLPTWFVDRCAPEQTKGEAAEWLARWRKLPPAEKARATEERGWSLLDWLYWLRPAERQWFWWDGQPLDNDVARIVVEVKDTPTALGALEWLLKAAGAERVVEANRAA
jgi:hypothetical protein